MATDPRIGLTVLGKYRIDRVIGSGGMGTVYEAADLRLERPVAIKILRPVGGAFGDVAKRFRREARTIAQVTHPNVVTLIEFDLLDDETPAMVMERVNGESLRTLMRTRKFAVLEVIEILRQSLSALSVCHDAAVVHRDLKPGNVLVEDKGGELHVKIIDFGLTKIMADNQSVLTAHGEIFGSPRFMAPEQWMSRDVDGRTDLYALGLIGYCLLAGRHFIRPGNPVEVCQAHLKQPRPIISHDAFGTPVPDALLESLRRATAPKISERFPDALTMRRAITGAAPSGVIPVSADHQLPVEHPTKAEMQSPLVVSMQPGSAAEGGDTQAFGGPPVADEAATIVDPSLAALVRQATEDSDGVDSGPMAPPVSPRQSLSGFAGLADDHSIDLDTHPVPHEVANAVRAIPLADFEAALRATDEKKRPAPTPLAPAAPVGEGPSDIEPRAEPAPRPTTPAERAARWARGSHPARRTDPPPERSEGEEEFIVAPWMLAVAGLVAAGAAAAVVFLLR